MNGKKRHFGTATLCHEGSSGFAAPEVRIGHSILLFQGYQLGNAFGQLHKAAGCRAADTDPFVGCRGLVERDRLTAEGDACDGFCIDDLVKADPFVSLV